MIILFFFLNHSYITILWFPNALAFKSIDLGF